SVDLGNRQERGRKQRITDIRRSDATINKKKTVQALDTGASVVFLSFVVPPSFNITPASPE
nr:hypothetical protein [Escherichia coli]